MDAEEKQLFELLLDYKLGQCSPSEQAHVAHLLATEPRARRSMKKIESLLRPLSALEPVEPPTEMVQKTMQRIAAASRKRLQQIERTRAKKTFSLREALAVAAAVMLVASIVLPGWRKARDMAGRIACQANLGRIGAAIGIYRAEHNSLPRVPNKPGAVWWNIGQPGPENTSNTRSLYLVIKNRYARPELFACPGLGISLGKLDHPERLNDFPGPERLAFSYVNLFAPNWQTKQLRPDAVILADRNPFFTRRVRMRVRILRPKNSSSHGENAGQNVLRLNGEVFWTTEPTIGPNRDDIWTVADKPPGSEYVGTEVPHKIDDEFIAP